MGLTIVQWNCDSNDWQYTNVEDQPKLFTNIANKINPSDPTIDSFITLQHDIKDYSIEYIPKIIDLISGKGYKFVTVEQCLGGKVPAYTTPTVEKAKAGISPAAIITMIIFGLILVIFVSCLLYYK
jgi:peptidoglycan/xylan/chitin deacetylase (PgdA/CDA1 family)